MSRPYRRSSGRSASSPWRRQWRALLIAAVVGVLAIVTIRVATGGVFDRPPTPSTVAGCAAPSSVNIASSVEKAPLLARMAAAYHQSHACGEVNVYGVESGKAEAALQGDWRAQVPGVPLPDVWSPASSIWINLLRTVDRQQTLPTGSCPSIATLPLVLAMPKPMADLLLSRQRSPGWQDILSLSRDPMGWGRYGRPDWGLFKLGRTNPHISTSGLMASAAMYFAATAPHVSSDLTESQVNSASVQSFVRDIEHSVIHYGDNELVFLAEMQKADDRSADDALHYASAVVVEEKAVWDYNEGNPSGDPATLGKHAKPHVPLVPIYPREGTLESDEPYCILPATSRDAGRRQVAQSFLDYLRAPAQQGSFQSHGFRSFNGKAGGTITRQNGFQPSQPATIINPPAGSVLATLQKNWDALRKPARVLLVLDVSGSMSFPVTTPTGAVTTKLALMEQGADLFIDQFRLDDQLGLWIFSEDLGQGRKYIELSPIAPAGPQMQRMHGQIDSLQTANGTALYYAASAAEQRMLLPDAADYINAIVLLTDGKNEETSTSTTEKDLISELQQQTNSQKGVRIFTIGYGADADTRVLNAISAATNGLYVSSTDPNAISSVFAQITAKL